MEEEDYQFSNANWTQATEKAYQKLTKEWEAREEAIKLEKRKKLQEHRDLIAALNQANVSEHKKWLQMNPHVVCKCRTCDQRK